MLPEPAAAVFWSESLASRTFVPSGFNTAGMRLSRPATSSVAGAPSFVSPELSGISEPASATTSTVVPRLASLEVIPVGDVSGQVGEGQLLGFDEVMEVLGGVVAHALQIEGFQKPQHLEGGDSLARRGELPDLEPSKRRRDGFYPLRPMVSQVVEGEEPSLLLDRLNDGGTQRSTV